MHYTTKATHGVIFYLSLFIFIWLGAGCENNSNASRSPANVAACQFDKAIETDGIRKLAVIVGVGEYKYDKIPDLEGPPNDANRMYELLTNKQGYAFPPENVCLLLDDKATVAGFKEAFDKGLVARARKQDVAVIFFAGHGSQREDFNGDEPDNKDETFVFHDSRSGKVTDLVDDDFSEMLAHLYRKTNNIALFIDSCNSGSATRAAGTTNFIARFFEEETNVDSAASSTADGDGDGGWAPDAMPGLVAFTAASDGTPALETGGKGIFTDAVVKVLAQASSDTFTYAQAARQIPPLVSARSYQIPYFHGHLEKAVFANKGLKRPSAWEVSKVGQEIELGGIPLPGIDVGAEMRIYSGDVSGDDTRDPRKAKATAIITEFNGTMAKAQVRARTDAATKLSVGDLAVLVRPADKYLGISVRIRPSTEAGGIDKQRAQKLIESINNNVEAKMLVKVQNKADFELSSTHDGQLVLRGPENNIRNTYESDKQVADSLWQHARQQALLQLQGEGGSDFTDNDTLQVQVIPATKQTACAKGNWVQSPPNTTQVMPLCHRWNIKVTLKANAPKPLLIGAVIQFTDGSSYGLPSDGRKVLLRPGESTVFNYKRETFQTDIPLDTNDHIMVFGTQETNPVAWHQLTKTADQRSTTGIPKSGLYAALDRYLQPGTRGGAPADIVENTTWTMTTLTTRVEANQRFLKADKKTTTPINKREYTIANFDIRPYLPDDKDSILYRVLKTADGLAHASLRDGYSYKQHDWSGATDEENLKRGIDCSRSIWYAFTRTGLPYNRNDRYLTTAGMATDDSAMADQFERCDGQDPIIGDVIVYRDDTRGDGHVVMVIDPIKRIAWGSHGWDGNAKKLGIEPDTGVEYQLIKYKQDWQRWDRSTMQTKACWRYRKFSEERKTGRGIAGVQALSNVCDVNRNCGN